MISQQHLSQWPKILFGKNPIDAGLTYEEYWEKLQGSNLEIDMDLAEIPAFQDSFFHQAAPKPHENQRAILEFLGELVRRQKSSLTYVCWPCGFGKTTCMLEMGHQLAKTLLTPKGRQTLLVRLVLANAALVENYR